MEFRLNRDVCTQRLQRKVHITDMIPLELMELPCRLLSPNAINIHLSLIIIMIIKLIIQREISVETDALLASLQRRKQAFHVSHPLVRTGSSDYLAAGTRLVRALRCDYLGP